jgi:hypothetical protein
MAGMINEEADEIVGAFAPLGLREDRRIVLGEWTGARLVRA